MPVLDNGGAECRSDEQSWERGLNENTNRLIRQYFTKGSSFQNITDEDVEAVMDKLNHRPRKTLNYQTPHAVLLLKTGKTPHDT